jgi:thiopeptide-type bacteriocin biosynthesis protein
MAPPGRIRYRCAAVPLLRATTFSGPALAAPPDPEAGPERLRRWLPDAWADHRLRSAVAEASPALASRIEADLAGAHSAERRLRRLVRSLLSYQLRWQHRATPFGLLAGVAPARISDTPRMRWGREPQVWARADETWLERVVTGLETHGPLLDRWHVVANPTAYPRGGRLVAPGRAPAEPAGAWAPVEVSLHRTGPVRTVLDAARTPIQVGDLIGRVRGAHPTAPEERVRALVADLIAHNVLVTDLRAPMTTPDALGHLVHRLGAAGSNGGLGEQTERLGAVHADLLQHWHTPNENTPSLRARIRRRMAEATPATEAGIVLAAGLDVDAALPPAVIAEAEAAAAVLVRLSPHPYGHPHWRDFHARFRQRYGPGALVGVRDLLSDSGLGLPAGYADAAAPLPPRVLTARDEALLGLAQQAALDRRTEIVLTAPLIDRLDASGQDTATAPHRVELAVQVHAASADALGRGDYRLLVTVAPRPQAGLAGRFAELLPAPLRADLAATYAPPEGDAVAAQLSFSPRRTHARNVTRTPRLTDTVLPLSEHRPTGDTVIEVADLGVTGDERRLHLVQMSTGRRVYPFVPHAAEAGRLTPPLSRFLSEVATARDAVYGAFDWGAAGTLPFLPRIRYGRTVISAARWRIDADDVAPRQAAATAWSASFERWRARTGTPRRVVMCHGEQRLPLDVAEPAHRDLLRARLNTAGRLALREAPDPAAFGWAGRPHEFLLVLRTAPDRRADRPTRRRAGRPEAPGSGRLPGHAAWISARLHAHPLRQAEIITDHLPRLLAALGTPAVWWFTRHHHAATAPPHLAIHAGLTTPAQFGPAAAHLGSWAAGLRDHGLAGDLELTTHHPQEGRYGHDGALHAAEAVFTADSRAALAQLHMSEAGSTPIHALTAASLVDIAATLRGPDWLIHNEPRPGEAVEAELIDATLHLLAHTDLDASAHPSAVAAEVAAAWRHRRRALTDNAGHTTAHADPDTATRSLLRAHHGRCVGDDDGLALRLARAAAVRLRPRPATGSPPP